MSYTSATGPFNIPDNNTTGITVPISVGDAGTISSFNSVTISGFSHTWNGDLQAFISNGTTTVQLFNCGNSASPCFAISSRTNNGFDLSGNYGFANAGADWETVVSNPRINTTYQSLQSLSAFNGSSVTATWTLNVQDLAGFDTGSFNQWSFNADVSSSNPVNSVPFEFNEDLAVLTFLGIVGMGKAIEKWKKMKKKDSDSVN